MGISAIFAQELPHVYNEGEDAVFTPVAGDPIPCRVFIKFNVLFQPGGAEAQVWQRGTTIEALLSDLGREPNREDNFVVDGTIYTVRAILENDGLEVKMVVT